MPTTSPLFVGESRRLRPSFRSSAARVASALLACAVAAATTARAANEPRFVPDVIAQFNALTSRRIHWVSISSFT